MGCQRAAGGLHTIGGFAGKALMMLPGCAEGSGQGLTHRVFKLGEGGCHALSPEAHLSISVACPPITPALPDGSLVEQCQAGSLGQDGTGALTTRRGQDRQTLCL